MVCISLELKYLLVDKECVRSVKFFCNKAADLISLV